jgi:hypothetical protein
MPVWEEKYSRGCVLFQSVCASYGVFYSLSYACVVVFGVRNVGLLLSEGGIASARGDKFIFRIEGVTSERA